MVSRRENHTLFASAYHFDDALKNVKPEARLQFIRSTLGKDTFSLIQEYHALGEIISKLLPEDQIALLQDAKPVLPKLLPTTKQLILFLRNLDQRNWLSFFFILGSGPRRLASFLQKEPMLLMLSRSGFNKDDKDYVTLHALLSSLPPIEENTFLSALDYFESNNDNLRLYMELKYKLSSLITNLDNFCKLYRTLALLGASTVMRDELVAKAGPFLLFKISNINELCMVAFQVSLPTLANLMDSRFTQYITNIAEFEKVITIVTRINMIHPSNALIAVLQNPVIVTFLTDHIHCARDYVRVFSLARTHGEFHQMSIALLPHATKHLTDASAFIAYLRELPEHYVHRGADRVYCQRSVLTAQLIRQGIVAKMSMTACELQEVTAMLTPEVQALMSGFKATAPPARVTPAVIASQPNTVPSLVKRVSWFGEQNKNISTRDLIPPKAPAMKSSMKLP